MDHVEAKMKVAEVIDCHPETIEVFLSHDCPDMRNGLFRAMSRLMSVRWAAWMHGIPLNELLRDLNEAVEATADRARETDAQ